MNQHHAEIDYIKTNVNCAVVLERFPPVWRLDAKESSRDSLKYRRGKGEVIIVNHDGRGWWDPKSAAKGDVFSLVQHLDHNLDFGAALRALRPLAGLPPEFPPHLRSPQRNSDPDRTVGERWSEHPRLVSGSSTWRYLSLQRALPDNVLLAAANADAVREGPSGSAWFAHRGEGNEVVGIEMRGPDWRSFAKGGLGEHNIATLQSELTSRRNDPAAMLVAATNDDEAGHVYADRLAELATAAGVHFERILPHGHNDWNDYLRAQTSPASSLG